MGTVRLTKAQREGLQRLSGGRAWCLHRTVRDALLRLRFARKGEMCREHRRCLVVITDAGRRALAAEKAGEGDPRV